MRLKGPESSQRNAKRLRREMSPPEITLWLALRQNEQGIRFRRQHAAGAYVLDFYCAPAMLAIEVDGEAHNRGNRPARDAERDVWLSEQGVLVLRYPAEDILTNLDRIVDQILEIAAGRRPPLPSATLPPPPGGGGFQEA